MQSMNNAPTPLTRRLTPNDQNLIATAVETFAQNAAVRARVVEDADVDLPACVEVEIAGHAHRFPIKIARTLPEAKLVRVTHPPEGTTPPFVVITPYIGGKMFEKWRELGLCYMDGAGNARLEADGLFIQIAGNPKPPPQAEERGARSLTAAGLRVTFALLCDPKLAEANYREIAKRAGVALGVAGPILKDLERRGQLIQPERKRGPKKGDRQAPRFIRYGLTNPEQLLNEWTTHYPIRLRPKLHPRRFEATEPQWWKKAYLLAEDTWWGGEVAGQMLTNHLIPATFTLYKAVMKDDETYGGGMVREMVREHKLRPAPGGAVEMLDAFWHPGTPRPHAMAAPPILVYADLMATMETRCIETARIIHERYIAPAFHPAG